MSSVTQTCDAVMPNICVVPLVWWAAGAKAKGLNVVTCVKLWHAQQLVGRRIVMTSTMSLQGMLQCLSGLCTVRPRR